MPSVYARRDGGGKWCEMVKLAMLSLGWRILNRMLTYQSYVQGLEDKKRLTPNGAEYWMARDLQSMLGYASWENFESAIERARMACESAGGSTTHHFHATTNMITAGKGAQRERADLALSRYACYMIAMNADSGKQEVGYAQTYFAIQARRQEVQDQLAGTDRRLELRDRVKSANKNLTSAAKAAGVQKYGVFHDAGYKGMYGGIGKNGVQLLKGIPPNEDLLDCIGRAELAAHELTAHLPASLPAQWGGPPGLPSAWPRADAETEKCLRWR